MELRQLEYFVAVATELSFSQGAKQVHVVQSAVSASIAKLENDLGAALFDRSRQRISLTAAGAALLPEARIVLNAARRAADSVVDYRDNLSGSVTFAILLSHGSVDLTAVLARFHDEHPLVRLRLTQPAARAAERMASIADGSLDLALVARPVQPPPGVRVVPLAREAVVLLCPPGHRLEQRASVSLPELAGDCFVALPQEWIISEVINDALANADVRLEFRYEAAALEMIADLVRSGLGPALLPESAAKRFPELHTVHTTPAIEWEFGLAVPTGRSTPAAAAFTRTLLAEYGVTF
ncbi:LysR family transcriptional regulator [Nocardia sp. NPDC005978]|uniref:LysR family transcriptional regulator n=1 Tax=unclassified Nocardia TaxID=2637762 RepID=UPI0033BC86D5